MGSALKRPHTLTPGLTYRVEGPGFMFTSMYFGWVYDEDLTTGRLVFEHVTLSEWTGVKFEVVGPDGSTSWVAG